MSNEPSSPSGRRVVSLFSGAGGLDLGLERAGWRIVAQVEMDADCAGTLANEAKRVGVESRAGSELAELGDEPIGEGERAILCSPIEGVDPGQLRDALGLEPGALDLLAGGPPCQPFTTTGLRKAITDRRAETAFPTWLKYVDSFQPRAFLMENVDGLLSAALKHRPLARRGKGHPPLDDDEKKGSFLRWLLTELCDRGYSVTWGVVEAADYGVPQMRQRALLVGVRALLLPPTCAWATWSSGLSNARSGPRRAR